MNTTEIAIDIGVGNYIAYAHLIDLANQKKVSMVKNLGVTYWEIK